MFRNLFSPCLGVLFAALTTALQAATVTNCCDIASLPPISGQRIPDARVCGKVQARKLSFPVEHPDQKSLLYSLTDASGGTFVMTPTNESYEVGDILEVSGTVEFVDHIGQNVVKAVASRILLHEPPDPPRVASHREIRDGNMNFHIISASGTVIDAFHDELDPRWNWILTCNNGTLVPLAFRENVRQSGNLTDLIGCDISFKGLCVPTSVQRRFLSPSIRILKDEDLRIDSIGHEDLFASPLLNPITPAKDLQRNCIDGRVLATWGGSRAFVQPQSGQTIEIQLHPDSKLPAVGETIRASGFAASDIFHTILIQTIWKRIPDIEIRQPAVLDISPRRILTDNNGNNQIELEYHGKLIRLHGTIAGTSYQTGEHPVLLMSCDGHLVQMDISSFEAGFTAPLPGTTLSATGVCRMEFDAQRQIAGFSRIKGFTFIIRSPNDLTITELPPWWTPLRLTVLVGVLVLLLVSILLWNLTLRVIAERRGRELFRENVAHISADLRTEERTRLAVDLHDSLAQMLTGVSFQIDAGELEIASKSLKSCRDELRNCLWDLRNQTLEQKDMCEAIRRTLKPHVGDAELLIRFNVPRDKLSDLTAHSVLMIVRELVTNAVRHGHAKTVRIAGGLDGDALMLSVRDDGTGFDPDKHPGMAEGHFGLQGIRERVKRCDGTLSIDSAPGRGTKVTVSLKRQK